MAARACVVALLLAASVLPSNSRDCIELTLPEKHIFNSTIFNRTLFVYNESSVRTSDKLDVMRLWDRFPKVVVPVNASSEQCRRDGQHYLAALDRLELWALKMFDATAKLPSGILSGNANQYGDYDECLSVDGAVRGKYCLASLQLTISGNNDMENIDYLLHSGHYLKSNLTDMGHRLPRYSSIMWGVCIPSSCSSYDLEAELRARLGGEGIAVKVHNTMCSVKDVQRPYSFAKTLTITFFLALLLLLSLGTLLDDGGDATTNFDKILNAFSLRRNFKKLIDLGDSQEHIKGVDAFRGMNAFALLIAHKSMAIAHNPYTNKTRMAEVFGMHWAVIGRSAILYTDSFLYLSGFLNAFNLFKELERTGTIDFKNRLVSRWFRLFPVFLSLMLFCTYILPDVNNGPQWNLVVEEHSRVCQRSMWRSFLFIHNYFGFEEMCLTHTHQLGIDFQLYLVTLPLLLLLWKARTLGWTVIAGIAVASTVLRYLAVYWYDISMVVYYGISIQKLLAAARLSYILPTHRATIYFIGVAMAYFIRYQKFHLKLSENQRMLLWAGCFSVAGVTIASPMNMGLRDYQYEPGPAAMFAAFSPVAWGVFMCVAHWAIVNDYAGVGTSFVDSRFFKMFSKIAYSVYLTQFPIFFYNVGVQRNSDYYTPLLLFHVPEMLAIFGISTLATVAIEMPFNEIHRIYFGKKRLNKLKGK